MAVGVALLLGPSAAVAQADGANGVNGVNGVDWDALAECESGGDWHADTGNGFYGGLQFKQSTWDEFGGKGPPADASRAEQIAVANRVLAGQGPWAWPKCGTSYFHVPPVPGWLPRPVRDLAKTLWSLPH